MDKRYQVFVSSTYTDLKEERQTVIQTLMEMDCIPAGMELFPAADEDQFEFIKRVIDDCDYYILIIGGRYGSLAEDQLSYTEKEYDYAVAKGKKVIALLHKNPGKIPNEKTEVKPELKEKLEAFRRKASSGRLVDFWEDAKDLRGSVSLSLNKTIKMFPAVGWVRGDKVASDAILTEINDLRKENETLRQQSLKAPEPKSVNVNNLAKIDESYCFTVKYKTPSHGYTSGRNTTFEHEEKWIDIFTKVSLYLEEHPNEGAVASILGEMYRKLANNSGSGGCVDRDDIKTIGLQLEAYGLVSRRYSKTIGGQMNFFWALTDFGKTRMLELRTVKAEI